MMKVVVTRRMQMSRRIRVKPKSASRERNSWRYFATLKAQRIKWQRLKGVWQFTKAWKISSLHSYRLKKKKKRQALFQLHSISFIYISMFWLLVCLFTFGSAGSLLLLGFFLQLQWAGATLQLGYTGFHCGGFSCCSACTLEHRVNSCGSWAQLLPGVWDLLRSGITPVSPALAGGLFTTEPPGRPSKSF